MKTSILVQNLKCGGCANTINYKISNMENISNLHVDVEASKISFEYINELDAFKVKEILKNIGYPSIQDTNSVTSKAK